MSRASATSGWWRDVDIPDEPWDGATARATGKIKLPLNVAWSGQGAYDFDDPKERRCAYAIVLAEGTKDDMRQFIDLDTLVEDWDRIHISPDVRKQWGDWLREHGLIV